MERLNPNYVLRANELAWEPLSNCKTVRFVKKAVYIILAVIIFGSLLLGENLFSELSFPAKVLLIVLCIKVLITKETDRVPCPFEIWFYDEYLIIYREKRYYDPKNIQKEYIKICYDGVRKVQLNEHHRLTFYGVVEAKAYKYRKDGTLPNKPCHHKITDSMDYFYTSAAPEVDFVAEIERHTPLKVQIQAVD